MNQFPTPNSATPERTPNSQLPTRDLVWELGLGKWEYVWELGIAELGVDLLPRKLIRIIRKDRIHIELVEEAAHLVAHGSVLAGAR